MAIPSKARAAAEAEVRRLASPPPTTTPLNSPRWTPPGFTCPMAISGGKHIARIDTIEGFQSKRHDCFFVKIYLVCQDGEVGVINLTFSNDTSRSWINGLNSDHFGQILAAAGLTVANGEYPPWDKLTDRLQGIWFKIQVGIGKTGSPYLTSLKPLQDGKGPLGPRGSKGRHTSVGRDMDSVEEPADAGFGEEEDLN